MNIYIQVLLRFYILCKELVLRVRSERKNLLECNSAFNICLCFHVIMLDLSCQTKLITNVKYRNVYSNQPIAKSGNKELLSEGYKFQLNAR